MAEMETLYNKERRIELEDWRKSYAQQVWNTEAGKCLINMMMDIAQYWQKDTHRGEFYDGMRHLIDETFFLVADPQDLIKSITQGEKYGRQANTDGN
jgi:hypothetical protein